MVQAECDRELRLQVEMTHLEARDGPARVSSVLLRVQDFSPEPQANSPRSRHKRAGAQADAALARLPPNPELVPALIRETRGPAHQDKADHKDSEAAWEWAGPSAPSPASHLLSS